MIEANTCSRTEENGRSKSSFSGLVGSMASLNGTLPLIEARERWLTGLHGGSPTGDRSGDGEESDRSLTAVTDPSHHSPPKSWATLQALGHDHKRLRGDSPPRPSLVRSPNVVEVTSESTCTADPQKSPPLEQQMLDDILLDWTTSSLSPLSISPLSPPLSSDSEGFDGTHSSFLGALCAPLPLEWESIGRAGVWTRIWVLERPSLRACGVWRFQQGDSIDEIEESPV